jgi:hypothetical protein
MNAHDIKLLSQLRYHKGHPPPQLSQLPNPHPFRSFAWHQWNHARHKLISRVNSLKRQQRLREQRRQKHLARIGLFDALDAQNKR